MTTHHCGNCEAVKAELREAKADRVVLDARLEKAEAELARVRAERDEAREQRNKAQMTWDDEHDAKLKAEAALESLRAAAERTREALRGLLGIATQSWMDERMTPEPIRAAHAALSSLEAALRGEK